MREGQRESEPTLCCQYRAPLTTNSCDDDLSNAKSGSLKQLRPTQVPHPALEVEGKMQSSRKPGDRHRRVASGWTPHGLVCDA